MSTDIKLRSGNLRQETLSIRATGRREWRLRSLVATALYCRERALSVLVDEVLQNIASISLATEWTAFEQGIRSAEVAIVVIPWLTASQTSLEMRRVKHVAPLVPLVLVTRGNLENARLLREVASDEVLWIDEIPTRLPRAINAIRARCLLLSVENALAAAPQADPRLRAALSFLCESRGPIPSQSRLASAVGVHRSALWRMWHEFAPSGGSLKDLVDRITLVRTLEQLSRRISRARIAQALGIHEHTMNRICIRLTGHALSDVTASIGQPRFDQVQVDLVAAILADIRRDNLR